MPTDDRPVSAELRAILNAAGTMIIATELDGTIRIFNPAAELLLGWSAAEVVGRRTPAIWHDADEVAVRAAELSQELGRTVSPGFEVFVAKVRQQLNEQRQWTYIRKDGSRFPVQLVVSAIRGDAGTITGYVGTAQDLTARVHAEQQRDRFFDLSLDMLAVAGTDGYFKRVNPAFRRTLGWDEEEILSRPFLELVHPDDQAATVREVEKLATGEPTLHFENRYRCKDGTWRWLAWTSTPQPDGTLYATARDVTELKQAEEALRQSERKLAITLHAIGDAVLATDASRRITRMNPVAEQLTGWPQAEAMGRTIDEVFEIIHEETRQPVAIPVDGVLETGGIHGLANYTILVSRDGTEWPIADSAAPIRDDAGNTVGVVLVFRDVTDQRRLERALQQSNADLERFNRATLDALSAHLAVLDEAGNIVATNRAWKEFAEANRNVWQIVSEGTNYLASCDRAAQHGDTDAAAAAAAIRRVIAGEQDSWFREYPCHAPHGQRWFHCRVTRFATAGMIYVTVSHEDITEMKQAQHQLAASRARYESLSHVSPVGIILFDTAGQCEDVNRRWCEMTGMPHAEALGDGWREAVHPEDRERVLEQWTAAIQRRHQFRSEHRLRPNNGHTTWVVCQAEEVTNSLGEVIGYVRTLTDVTRQKQIEQALRFLSADLATLSGVTFYETACTHLAKLVNCEITAVCRLAGNDPDRLVTLALCEHGEIQPNVSYPAAGTPCEEVVERGNCVISRGVQRQYPVDAYLTDKQVEAYVGVRLVNSMGRQLGHIVAMSCKPLHDPDQVESIVKLFSMSVVAEMERQQLARRNSDLFEFSSDAIVLSNRDGIIVQVNRQVENVFGWKRNELVGKPVELLVPSNIREEHIQLRQRYLESAVPRPMGGGRPDLSGERKDGTIFPVDISLSPMETEWGPLIAAAVRDVSERQRADDALHDAKMFADTVIESVSGLFFVLDQDGAFVRWNQSLQDLLGLSVDEMWQTPVLSIIHEADRPRIAGSMDEAFSQGYAEAEARLLLENGVGHFLLSGRRLDINGVVYLAGTGADISDRKRAEEEVHSLNQNLTQRVAERTAELSAANAELQKASHAKSEFLATMSHELRTPLNGVLGMNELLLATELDQRQRQYVGASHASGKVLLQLINDILDLSKIEAGKLELDLRQCDFEALVFDVVEIMDHAAHQRGLELNCRLAAEACVVGQCDDNRLRQVLVNLVSNAIKFTTTGGVTIAVDRVAQRESSARLRFDVTDTGVGIPAEQLDRLFIAFSQVDSSTTRRFGGTGLGLSICKQLIELMGGEIGVESQVGVGTTFWFEIDTIVSSWSVGGGKVSPKEELPAPLQQPAAKLKGHILVAEDNRINQLYIVELLKHFGCTSDVVVNGEEALDAVRRRHYDLVLMDCQMPEMDGYLATREIRKREASNELHGRIPIVALTANALKGDRQRCLDAGMDDYLSKPLEGEQLRSVLEKYLH